MYDVLGDDIDGDDILGDDILGDDIPGNDLAIVSGDGNTAITGDDLMGLSKAQKIALLAAGGTAAGGLGYALYKRAVNKKRAQQARASKLIAAKRVQHSPVLAMRPPQKGRWQPLNFFQAAIPGAPASPATQVTQRPQTLFRGRRVILPEQVSVGGMFAFNPFTVIDLKVGRNSQFVASQQAAASVFFQTAFGAGMQIDTGQISQDITFTVSNRAASAADFEATILGEAVE